MRVITAYLLCVMGGNETPGVDDIKNVFKAAGIDDSDKDGRIEKFVGLMKGKNIFDVINAGKLQMGSLPMGGMGGSGGSTEKKEEEKEEEPEPEPEPESESESDDDMFGGGLFD
ncbi:60S ACIDIC ribosomal protein FAMILY MEMBER [Anaeramoeba flamelloides]|uniref:60S ACIDIC ribosomal protein FAMILY MEMBER n=1 Tax=Anaeramoeba flamelloides TaxID=1746091 RepID=A0AAV7ZIA8_9EUKA|nr:60S ACIDIC ribosomal protein FAMILY MEMBER [Anaeramoeba flamelloides]KAJ6228366.1 60S ACIDIC ribosomal protein FAMILY MEMBER [Anaeramoeba flamelloides]